MSAQAIRRLRRTPAFTVTAVALFALSIAAAASIGGLLEAVLLKPLPFRDPHRLLWVCAIRADPRRAQRGNNFIRAFARLRPGATPDSLQQEMKATQQRLKAEYVEAAKTAPPHVHVFADELRGAVRRPLWLLAGGVALLVIAVSANLGGLMLARGVARRGEFAVRAALGARAPQLVREVLVETALLALAGGAAGLGVAHWLLALLFRLGPRDLPRLSLPSID